MQTLTRDTTLDSISSPTCLIIIGQVFSVIGNKYSAHSKTSKLWLSYQQMLGVIMQQLQADRTGSWVMHLHYIADIRRSRACKLCEIGLSLYLQFMQKLERDSPLDQPINSGLALDVIWLSSKLFLRRSLKTAGGLARGSGMLPVINIRRQQGQECEQIMKTQQRKLQTNQKHLLLLL